MTAADIKQGIIDAIAAAFPNAPIYAEKVPQNFEDGSFRVKRITGTDKAELNTRHWREMQFDILYFPAAMEEAEAEWDIVSDRLFEAVEYITADGELLRGTDLSGEFDNEQDVGRFKVTYGVHLIAVKQSDPMQTLSRKNRRM